MLGLMKVGELADGSGHEMRSTLPRHGIDRCGIAGGPRHHSQEEAEGGPIQGTPYPTYMLYIHGVFVHDLIHA
jgi:hypothetical protein